MLAAAALAALQSAAVPEWFPSACGEAATPGATLAEIHDAPRAGHAPETAELWIDADGSIWARDSDLDAWLHRTITQPGRTQDGVVWHSLAQAGVPYRFDPCTLTLWLAPPRGVARVDLAQRTQAPLSSAPFSGFFNASYLGGRHEGTSQSAGLADVGLASGLVHARGQWLTDEQGTRRLDSLLDWDDPDRARRLRLGDDITRADLLGTPVRFGGLRWGTDFSLQPDQPHFPLPMISGQAALPSTLDLYVNGVRQAQQPVDPGSFTVVNPPIYTGGGELQVALRDETGRVTVYSQPFYVSTRALAAGVADYAVEGGWQRENVGQADDRYRDPFGLATWRYGLSDRLTAGTRVEMQSGAATAGVSGTLLQPQVGQLDTGLSASSGRDGGGEQARLGFERSAPAFTVGGEGTWASPGYVEVGRSAGMLARRLAAHAGMPLGAGATVGVAYSQEVRRDTGSLELTALSLSRPFGGWYGFASWIHSPGAGDTAVLGATHPQARGRSVSFQLTRPASGGVLLRLTWQLNAPGPLGWNSLISAGHSLSGDDTGDFQMTSGYAGSRGAARVNVSNQDGFSGFDGELDTALAWVGDDVYWTRPVREAFAVADANAPGVRIYRNNQAVGATGEGGRLLVPGVQPYEPTRLSLDMQDLPLDRAVGEPAQEVRIAPGGALVTLAQPAQRFAEIHLALDNGASVPAGAAVLVDGRPLDLPVGHEGLVYVSATGQPFTIEARWATGACRSDAIDPAATGTVTCRSIP